MSHESLNRPILSFDSKTSLLPSRNIKESEGETDIEVRSR